MKCPNCLNNLNAKFATCPYCRKNLPKLPTATINEVFHFEEPNQPQIWRGALQLLLLISCVIALATVINFIISDQPETAANSPETTVKDSTVAAPKATDSSAIITEEVQPAPIETVQPKAKTATQPLTISILSNAIVAAAQGKNSRTALVSSSVPMITTKQQIAIHNTSEIAPHRKPQIVERKTIQREIPPAPEMTNVNSSNSELRLEVDSSAVVLQKNIGLISINSYVPARIYIDGQFSGVTPRAVKLVAGDHHISLMADGYREYSRKVKVDGHQQIGMVASMTKKNTTQVAGIVEQ